MKYVIILVAFLVGCAVVDEGTPYRAYSTYECLTRDDGPERLECYKYYLDQRFGEEDNAS